MKMKTLLRLIGMTLALLLLLTAGACTMAQAEEEADEAEEAVEKEAPEGYDYKIYLDSNNHLVLQNDEEIFLDYFADPGWVWDESIGDFKKQEQPDPLFKKYFDEPVFLKRIPSEERVRPEVGIDNGDFYTCINTKGTLIYEIVILNNGAIQITDSDFNVYISEAGVAKE